MECSALYMDQPFVILLLVAIPFIFHFPFIFVYRRVHARGEAGDDRLQEGQDSLHERSAGRAGEGVPLQPLPVQTTQDRDGGHAETEWETDQDLVSEPPNEAQEGEAAE